MSSTASLSSPSRHIERGSRAEVVGFFDEMLREHVPADAIRVVVLPAPRTRPEALLAAHRGESLLWAPPGGPFLAGVGATAKIELRGDDRFTRAEEAAKALWKRVARFEHEEAPPYAPRLFGGFAFDPRATDATNEPWQRFGEGRFVLPRWVYGCDNREGWLAFAIEGAVGNEGRQQALAELERWLDVLAAPLPKESLAPVVSVEHFPDALFDAQVREVLDGIRDHEFAKVVVARRSLVKIAADASTVTVLRRLEQRHPSCTRFAFDVGGPVFVGATPERLVTKRGMRVETEALAGSMRVGESAALLASTKDRVEHELVVASVVERLEPFCRELDPVSSPRIRELTDVVHMLTPISGTLRRSTHVLDLVAALHPTPAVAGVPSDAAMRWVREHETFDRGWYAGPFGWIDERGDGEFVVALRAGVIDGPNAWIYAGAGIVAGSDPADEYAETKLKLRAMLEALGGKT